MITTMSIRIGAGMRTSTDTNSTVTSTVAKLTHTAIRRSMVMIILTNTDTIMITSILMNTVTDMSIRHAFTIRLMPRNSIAAPCPASAPRSPISSSKC